MAAELIRITGLSYRYPGSKKWALQDINLTVAPGELVALMGENGAGKTTLCQCLNGIIPHSRGGRLKGRVMVAGLDTATTLVARLALKVGMVLEDPETQLFTTLVKNEVAFGPENLGRPAGEIRRTITWALEVVGLQGYEERPPAALSGGQKQRLAIAAALAMQPQVLVLDEPTSQLDPVGSSEVLAVIRDLKERYGLTIVIATHDSETAAAFADRVCVLKEGRVLACDSPRVVFRDRELLRQAWVRPPQVAALADYIQARGVDLAGFPINLPEGRRMVTELL